jgi:molecular chaperone DnaK
VPQIEVTFDIDANGILNVSAKDKATNKEQKITIKANSGLSEEEVKKMIRDAEAHAAEDRKARELAEARNSAEQMVYATRKSLEELGDKVEAAEKKDVVSAIEAVEEALKGDDKSAIEAKTQSLAGLAGKLAERVYKAQAATAQAGAKEAPVKGDGAGGGRDENVVDAEFEEVDDDKK